MTRPDRSRRIARGVIIASVSVGIMSIVRRRSLAQVRGTGTRTAAEPTAPIVAARVGGPLRATGGPTVRRGATLIARGLVVAGAGLGLAAILLAVVCLAAGARPLIFRSGSMSPSIPAGSMAFARTVPAAELRVGDVVTVRVDDARVTHRIIALDRHGDVALLQLKGDANAAADRAVYPVRDAPRTWFSLPYLGSVVTWLGSPIGGIALAAYLLFAIAVLRGWTNSARRPVSTSMSALLRTRVLAGSTAALTLAGAGMGGWALPTWASWTDNANVSGTTIATGTWDVAAPSSSITNVTPAANAAGWYNANLTVTLTATDPAPSSGVAGIHYKLNGGAEQVISGASGTVSITTEGTDTLEFWAVDNAGFVESPHNTATFKLDKTPPPAPAFTSISSDTGSSSTDQITSTVSQMLSGSAEANSTVTVKQGSTVLGTTTTDGTGHFTFGPVTLAAGANTFTATATDVASNISPVSTGFPVTLDNVAPNSVVISPNDSAWHNTNTWTVTASDALSGVASVTYKIGAGSPTTVAASNNVAVSPATLPDGITTVQAYATDVAGVSSSSSPAIATIKVDTVKPTATLNLPDTAGNSPWLLGGAANVVGSDATSGVASVAYKIDSGSFTSVASGTGFTIPDGTHTITFHAVDFAGNVGTDVVQTVNVDTAAPSTTSASSPVANSNGWNNSSVSVTFSPTDPTPGSGVATVKYRTTLNGGTPSSFTTLTGPTYTAAISSQGTTLVEYQATDLAGNVEALKSTTVKIDTVAPTAVLHLTGVAGNSPWLLGGSANIVGADATSGVDHVEYQLDNTGAFTSLASGATFTVPDGTHSVTYRAVDAAGNVTANATQSGIKVDSTAPVLSGPTPANGATGTAWSTMACSASANQLCVTATDATSGVSSVTMKLARTSGTAQCWTGGGTFTNGSACPAQTMILVSAGQYRTNGLMAVAMTAGSYQATYTATDIAGNSTTLITNFTIVAAPVASCVSATPKVSVVVSWTAVANATGYVLHYGVGGVDGETVASGVLTKTFVNGAADDHGTFTVQAVVGGVNGPLSNALTYVNGQGSGNTSCG